MYSKKRVDSNQKQVVQELRELGYSVALTHIIGNGFPDFLVAKDGFSVPVELKSEGGKLTKDEEDFHKNFTGTIVIAFNTQDVVDGFNKYINTFHKKK